MRLSSQTSVFNMGDTSIRVKQVVEINSIVLEELTKFMRPGTTWAANQEGQESFYKAFINEIVRIEEEDGIELFADFKRDKSYELPKGTRLGLRGRTLTNALVKTGFINSERIISEVGSNYLNNNLTEIDALESLLSLSLDNLVYFRQFLKLRVYSSNSDKYFYNFRFALKFLAHHKDVPQNDFLTILLSIRPEQSEKELNGLIEGYSKVSGGNLSFDEFYKQSFTIKFCSQEILDKVKLMFDNNDFPDEEFNKYFLNAKSSDTSSFYKKFVLAIIKFKQTHAADSLNTLIDLSKKSKIKKAFSNNKLPFITRHADSPTQFLEDNKNNPLLQDDNFNIFLEFIFSKHRDLIREYSDMCKRSFEITGIISFDNKLANLTNRWILAPLLEIIKNKFSLTGEEAYSNYEKNAQSKWFSDISSMEILDVTTQDYQALIKTVGKEFNESDLSKIPNQIIDKREKEYRDFITKRFPKEKVIEILLDINKRNDAAVFANVTDSATVSTIFEYILTIAWFYLSENKNYNLHQSFGVSLDGNKLPLVHRSGGQGDIEVVTDDYALLIEATLMDISTQRRGELEPVIRHSINFKLDNAPTKAQTLFIANNLDKNVLNIFRAMQFIELNGTLETNKQIQGLNIFSFTTEEVTELLNNNITDTEIIETINKNLDPRPLCVANNWRESIVQQLVQPKDL